MTVRPQSLGVVYVYTHRDDPKEADRVHREIDQTVKQDYLMVPVDGDQITDLAACLNLGILACVQAGCEYITWVHGDFHYDDPAWYDTLRYTLEAYPEITKLCAANSRDEIHPPRIMQEQSWLMRSRDFLANPWLFFDERFLRCGGCEDYAQSLQILARGKLVVVTPEATVFHAGMQTRGKYDTSEHQRYNQGIFGQITHLGQLVEVHQSRYFGWFLDNMEYEFALSQLSPVWRKVITEPRCALPGPVGTIRHDTYPQYGPAIRALYEADRAISDFT